MYVDSINGNDTNNGLTEGSPKKTLTNVVSTLGIGFGGAPVSATVYLKRGSVFTETLDCYYGGIDSTNRLVFTTYGSGNKPIIDFSGANIRGIYFRSTNDGHITVENIAITGQSVGALTGISFPRASNLTDIDLILSGVEVYDVWDTNWPNSDVNGIKITGSNVLIDNCNVHDIATDNIWLSCATGLVIRNTQSVRPALDSRLAGDAIYINESSTNFIIEDCIIDHSNFACKQGIYINNTNGRVGGIIRRNKIYMKDNSVGTPTYALYCSQDNVEIYENEIHGGNSDKLYPVCNLLGNNIKFTNNLIIATCIGGSGIRVEGTGIEVFSNTVINIGDTSGTGGGISNLNATTGVSVKNNIVKGFSRGIDYYSTTTFSETNNILYDNAAPKVFSNTGVPQSLGANTVTTDPLLDVNYVPSSSSPCIGNGYKYWTTNNRPISFNGEPRPDTHIDIGHWQSLSNKFHPSNL